MKPWRDLSLRNSIFIRLITTFLLIIIPIFIFSFYVYSWNVQTARQDIAKSAESQVTTYMSDLENEIERMKLLLYDFTNDAHLNRLSVAWATLGNVKRTESVNLVRERLFTIKNSSSYIRNVSAHIPSTDISISATDGAYTFDEERYQHIRNEFGKASRIIIWQDQLHVSASKPGGLKGAQPLFVVEIELETSRLKEALQQFNTYSGSGSILMINETEFMVETGESLQVDSSFFYENDKLASLGNSESMSLDIDRERYLFTKSSSDSLAFTMFKYIPEREVLQPVERFYMWAWIFVIAAVFIIVIYTASTYKFIHKPLLTLVKSFRKMENGDLNLEIKHSHNDEFRYLYNRFNHMVSNLRQLIDEVYKQEIMMQRSELKQLQSQINPHFLYNSFFILNTMARTKDLESVELFSMQLGEYFQFITRNASDDIPLHQEIHHARIYTNIQAFRFSRRITVQFDPLPAEMEHLIVPRLIVQPIIENSFEHSLEKMERGGKLVIRFESTEDEWKIIVEDNGNKLDDEQLQRLIEALEHAAESGAEMTALLNIHRRLVLNYRSKGGLRIARSELGGLQVNIYLAKGG